MSAVMLAPGKFTFQQPFQHGWHFFFQPVMALAEVFSAKQFVYRSGCNGRHITASLVEPKGIPLFGYAIADEQGTRCTESNQFMGINREVATGLPAANRYFRSIFQVVAGHPVVFATGSEVFNGFAKHPAL